LRLSASGADRSTALRSVASIKRSGVGRGAIKRRGLRVWMRKLGKVQSVDTVDADTNFLMMPYEKC